MKTNRSHTAAYLAWFLFGGTIGAAVGGVIGTVVGILLAPKTGRETRHLLTEKAERLARRAQDLAAGAQVRASDWLDRGRAGDWLDKGREVLEDQARRLATAFEPKREATRSEPGGPAETPRG